MLLYLMHITGDHRCIKIVNIVIEFDDNLYFHNAKILKCRLYKKKNIFLL